LCRFFALAILALIFLAFLGNAASYTTSTTAAKEYPEYPSTIRVIIHIFLINVVLDEELLPTVFDAR